MMKKIFIFIFIFLFFILFSYSKEEAVLPRQAPTSVSATPELDRFTAEVYSSLKSDKVEWRVAREEGSGDYYIVTVKKGKNGRLEIVGEPKRIE